MAVCVCFVCQWGEVWLPTLERLGAGPRRRYTLQPSSGGPVWGSGKKLKAPIQKMAL